MLIPNSVRSLLRSFHQDIFAVSQSPDDAMAMAIATLTLADARDAKSFLSDLLDPSRSTAELIHVWNAIPKDIRIERTADIRLFLSLLRDRL